MRQLRSVDRCIPNGGKERESRAIGDRLRRIHIVCDWVSLCAVDIIAFVYSLLLDPLTLDSLSLSSHCRQCILFLLAYVCVVYREYMINIILFTRICTYHEHRIVWLYLNRVIVPFSQAQTKIVISRLRCRWLNRHSTNYVYKIIETKN